MKVVHISMSDRRGGAALAAFRLHQALRRSGVDSLYLTWQQQTTDPTTRLIQNTNTDLLDNERTDLIQQIYAKHKRSTLSNTYFSFALSSCDLSRHPDVMTADIVHLHWTGAAQSVRDIEALLALGKPVIWTLHDMAPFTGGCHFSAGCSGFKVSCANCPQLRNDPFDLPAAVLRDKLQIFRTPQLGWIAPSKWIADKARDSALLTPTQAIHHIPNGVDTELFRAWPKAQARATLGWGAEGVYLLCGADQADEKRKGFAGLACMLSEIVSMATQTALSLKLIWVGKTPVDPALANLPFLYLGPINQEETMALVYAASDLFVLPSQEDNLPNMLLEALSCGTPVLAFNAGGIGEVLQDGVQGRLIQLGDETGFQQALLELISDGTCRTTMGSHAATRMRERYSGDVWAARHLSVYQELLRTSPPSDSQLPLTKDDTGEALSPPSGPGPAVLALLPALTMHCLEQERQDLALALRDSERTAMLQAYLIEQQRADLEAKECVIAELHDHWKRAEATCLERLALIRTLGLKGRHAMLLQVVTRWPASALHRTRELLAKPMAQIRLDHWWYAKLPPLLAIAALCLLQSSTAFAVGARLLLLTGLTICCVAAYGHVINDFFDIASDRLAHKANTMERLKPSQRLLVCVTPLVLGCLTAAEAGFSGWAWLWLGLNFVWPTIYSVPGLRLKERGAAGVMCDAAGSHLTPTLLILTVFSGPPLGLDGQFLFFAATAVACSLALGLKGILNHQLMDRANDLASGTRTFATDARAGQIERFLPWFNAGIELPCNLLLVGLVLQTCPLAALAFVLYCLGEELKHLLGFQFALDHDPRNIRPSFPFVNDFFYDIWLPMAACLQLAWHDPHWIWLPCGFVLLFARTFKIQAQDGRSLMRALYAHRHPEFWRQKLLRAWSALKD